MPRPSDGMSVRTIAAVRSSDPLTWISAPGTTAPLGSLTVTRSVASCCCAHTVAAADADSQPAVAHRQMSLRITCSAFLLTGTLDGELPGVDLRIHLHLADLPLFVGRAFGGAANHMRKLEAVGVAPVLEEQRHVHERRLRGVDLHLMGRLRRRHAPGLTAV